ncbi:hypothetical protein NG895_25505 [Aeoliella sp. ICT_H6.2]|uniref:Uncharacterized protein n=1 Tax=Aeoliella straminimaris TaxID=2954799 RepID=A0A9X2FIK8_9BACT|nr:hypothetical protein [Aeoliella straminimaris]MCO6047271.1 hypothetical protein [Aeoliella straminimaris]
MSIENAWVVFAAIMTVGGLVWLVALALTLRIGKPSRDQRDFEPDPSYADEFAIESGTARMAGDGRTAARRLVRAILQSNQKLYGAMYKIVERGDSRIAIEKVDPLVCNQLPGTYFSHAEFDLRVVSYQEVEVHYRLDLQRIARLMRRISLLLLALAVVVMLVIGVLIGLLVIPSEQPAIRWQVVQTVQIVHVLWPPFLPIGIYTFGRRSAKMWVENLIATAEFVDEPE